MSHHDFLRARNLTLDETPIEVLVMAVLWREVGDKRCALQRLYPEIWTELSARVKTFSGRLPGESDALASVEPPT